MASSSPMDSSVCAAAEGGGRMEVPGGRGQPQLFVQDGQYVVFVPSRGTFPSSRSRRLEYSIEETEVPALSQQFHSGVGGMPGALEASPRDNTDVFDLHPGELVVTNVTHYQEPLARTLPSAAEGVVTAVTVPAAEMGVVPRPHVHQ